MCSFSFIVDVCAIIKSNSSSKVTFQQSYSTTPLTIIFSSKVTFIVSNNTVCSINTNLTISFIFPATNILTAQKDLQ